jgi:hypothetical protein
MDFSIPSTLPRIGTPESEVLEIKGTGYAATDKQRHELATDIVQFSNHRGGVLYLGISEDADGRVASYQGIPDAADQEKRIRDTALERIEPSPRFTSVRLTTPEDGAVLAIAVAPSLVLLGVRSIGDIPAYTFPYRYLNRRKYYTLSEYIALDSRERRATVMLMSVPHTSWSNKIVLDCARDSRPNAYNHDDKWSIVKVHNHVIEIKDKLGHHANLPLSFIEDIWPSDPYGEFTFSVSASVTTKDDKNVRTIRFHRARS